MWPFNTGDCLTEVTTWEGLTVSESIILRKQEKTLWKRWPLNTGDCLIEVTTWAGLTVLESVILRKQEKNLMKKVTFKYR